MSNEILPASSAIVERDGRYLLIRRRRAPAADLFAFPGGRGEPGESPAETALRELLEETGLVGRDPRLVATYDLPPETGSSSHFFLSVFAVTVDGDAEAIAASDAADAGWYLPEEITGGLAVPASVRECVERIVAPPASGQPRP